LEGDETVVLNFPEDYSEITGDTNLAIQQDTYLIVNKELDLIQISEDEIAEDYSTVDNILDVYYYVSSHQDIEKYRKTKGFTK